MTSLRSFGGARGQYTLRLARADEASILAHHRASMFRDMGEVDDQGAAIIANASLDHLAALIEAREYLGFLAEHESEVIGGGGVWLRPLLPRPGTPQGSMEAYVLNVYTEPKHRRGVWPGRSWRRSSTGVGNNAWRGSRSTPRTMAARSTRVLDSRPRTKCGSG